MIALNSDPFAWLVLAGLLVQGFIRAPFARARRANSYVRDDYKLDERFLIFLVFFGMGFIPALNLFVRIADPLNWVLPAKIALGGKIAGAIVLGFALWLFWRSHVDLGRNWSPSLQVRNEHTLTTGGVYTHVRHPMYAAIWLMGVAQLLLAQNWITGPACLLGFLPMHLIRIPREEATMRAQFGEAWDEFAKTRGRVTPWR